MSGQYISPFLLSWYNSLTQGKPSQALLNALNTIMDGLNSDGIRTELDLFHLVGGMETDEQRLKPLISTSGSNFTNVNSATLDSTGVTGNGTTSYLNLSWNPATNGVKFTQNDHSYGFYTRTNNGANMYDMGAANATIFIGANPRSAGNMSQYYMSAATNANSANSDSRGFFHFERTAVGASEAFKSGVSLGTSAIASSTLPSQPFYLGAFNLNGAAGAFSSRNVSACFAGSKSINEITFYNRVQAFMTTRGINV